MEKMLVSLTCGLWAIFGLVVMYSWIINHVFTLNGHLFYVFL